MLAKGWGVVPAAAAVLQHGLRYLAAHAAVLDPFQHLQQQGHNVVPIPEVKGRIHSTESFSTIDGEWLQDSVAGQHSQQRCC
jgi:hypothetical protein